jgi:ubiquinone/menaquinone biosynthesis C-methylase UbiE
MAKQGEIEYLDRLGPEGLYHARGKPFSDPDCGRYLMEMGVLLSLLPPPPGRLLDLGCGTGWTSYLFARRGYEVVGQDLAPSMIACALQNKHDAGLDNLEFITSDYESLYFDDLFDCAVFYDSLHHAVDEKAALQSAYRSLRDGGVCVTAEPGVGHSKSRDSIDHMQRFGVTEKDMPPGRIIRLAKQVGFRSFTVYPHMRHLRAFTYPGASQGLFRRLGRSNSLLASLGLAFVSMIYKHFNGIVVMVK